MASDLSIHELVESALPELSRKQRLVAEYILANPTTILFASVAEVADAAAVDPATVVRLAKRLGFRGFPELRSRLRSEHAIPTRPSEALSIDREAQTSAHATADLILEQTRSNVEHTFAQLDLAALDTAVETMLTARRVVIVAAGLSRAPAIHLGRVLQTAQISVHMIEDWTDLVYERGNLQDDDIVFSITAQRYMTVAVKALRVAKQAGCTTIQLTDSALAPGVNAADVLLLFSPRSVAEFYSPVGAIAIVDTIAALLAQRAPERVASALEQHVELSIEHDLSYW